MAKAKTYVVPFAGLSAGQHEFGFKIDDSFFENKDYSEIKRAKAEAKLLLNKQSTMLILDFSLEGTVNVMCDRCGDWFDQAIEGSAQLIVKFGETFAEEDEVVTIPYSESELDIEQYLYEYINLVIPQKRVHASIKDCNKEVISKLKKMESAGKDEGDLRWAGLKNLGLK